MADIQLKGLTKRWGSFTGLKPMDLHIGDGEFLLQRSVLLCLCVGVCVAPFCRCCCVLSL